MFSLGNVNFRKKMSCVLLTFMNRSRGLFFSIVNLLLGEALLWMHEGESLH